MKYEPNIVIAFFKAHGLPEPQTEFRFHPNRKWRFDFAFVSEKIALEVEGGIWSGGRHSRPKGILADIEKYSNCAIMGWILIRTTPEELCTEKTINLLQQAMKYREIIKKQIQNQIQNSVEDALKNCTCRIFGQTNQKKTV